MNDAVELVLGSLAIVLGGAAFALGGWVLRDAWRGLAPQRRGAAAETTETADATEATKATAGAGPAPPAALNTRFRRRWPGGSRRRVR